MNYFIIIANNEDILLIRVFYIAVSSVEMLSNADMKKLPIPSLDKTFQVAINSCFLRKCN